ncbi:MAG: hypothetical protein WD081_02605 [Gammaproteobacteria bacterium]
MTPCVALVTSEAFPQLYEDDRLLVPALESVGIEAQPAVWSDPTIDWDAFDALVMRSPWDYFERLTEFRAWLEARIESDTLLINPADVLVWNFDKAYLRALTAAGVSVVPTIVVAEGEAPDIVTLARAEGWDEIVVKPTIAGGGYATHRFRLEDIARYRDDVARTLQDRGLLIQPFLPEIQRSGELSLVFFDGEFSHAVLKRAKDGDYRVQFQYGGTHEAAEVEESWLAAARACIAAAPALPTYARVDGLVLDGDFVLMELEAFEPLLFLSREPLAAERFARAIERRIV